jgi:hypothetical protein
VQALGFANINHFVTRWINVPTFGYESCNSSNSLTVGLQDDGTGIDENANQPLNPANPIGNNAVAFDLQEGATDLRYFSDPSSDVLANYPPRPDRSGNLCVTYGRMDLLGSASAFDQVLVGVTPGHQPITTTPGINLSAAALAGDVPFPSALGIGMGGVIPASPYELFTLGQPGSYTITGGITTFPALPMYDLRQEGSDPAASTPAGQPDLNRGQVCFHNLNSQSITFGPLTDKTMNQLPIVVAATATSGLTVTFSISGGHCSSNGPTGSIIAALSSGSCAVIARQSGDAAFAPAPAVTRLFQILRVIFLPTVLR